MRSWICLICALLVATTSLGCGGATMPTPSKAARVGPPPDTSPDMLKVARANKPK